METRVGTDSSGQPLALTGRNNRPPTGNAGIGALQAEDSPALAAPGRDETPWFSSQQRDRRPDDRPVFSCACHDIGAPRHPLPKGDILAGNFVERDQMSPGDTPAAAATHVLMSLKRAGRVPRPPWMKLISRMIRSSL